MKQFQSSVGSTIKINMDLLFATCLGATAWLIWPTNIKWYGFGFLSICCGLAAVAVTFRALRTMLALYTRDKAMAAYFAQGNQPKASTLASQDIQKNAGMR